MKLTCNLSRFAAAVCLLAGCGTAMAQEGTARISDANPPTSVGTVRMSDMNANRLQLVGYTAGCTDYGCSDNNCTSGCQLGGCQSGGCQSGGWCDGGNCQGCQTFCGCNPCQCNPCQCSSGTCYGDGHNQRMCRLFAGSADSCHSGGAACSWLVGQRQNYCARNQRLSNCLFGWMIPSGCCGQGCPPVGKYQITYADDPAYADPRDGQLYGAQGYGVPVTVPTAPNVRFAYNYSWGTPASRLTPLSTYNPQTSPQPLYHQSW